MTRTRVSWSNFVDQISGPCVACQKDVTFMVPSDRPDPAILFHPTCDPMPALREKLKTATPPPLRADFTIRFKDKPLP